MRSAILLLCLLQGQVFAAFLDLFPRVDYGKPHPPKCDITHIRSVFHKDSECVPQFCSSYLHYPTKKITVTKTLHITHSRAKTTTVTNTVCTSTLTLTNGETTITRGPPKTVTEVDVTYTKVILTFGGSFIEGNGKRSYNTNLPASLKALTTCAASLLSPACSSIAHKPTTKTVTATRTSTPTVRVTLSACQNFDFDLITETVTEAPSTSFVPGFFTKTVSVTTETVPYYCYSYSIGCNPTLPTPCCPGTCIDPTGGINYVCTPTDTPHEA